jgi:pimeloyl-ACP methyl ester carboxylesterase
MKLATDPPRAGAFYPAGFPYASHYVTVGDYRVAYLETGSGRRTLLMVHGNPVSGYVFHRLMGQLQDEGRCLAPDLVGFGLSSKPADEAAYSLEMHAATIAGLVRRLDLRRIVLIVHDWGVPLGLAAALAEPERYQRLVILNGPSAPIMTIPAIYKLPFHFFRHAGGLFSWLERHTNFFQRMGVADMEAADQEVFLRANGTAATRAGIAKFPKMIPFRPEHPSAPFFAEVFAGVEAWHIPALVVFSDHDSVFSVEEGRALAGRLAQARFVAVKGPKHFLQYQAPAAVAAAIKSFLAEEERMKEEG